MKSMWLTLVKSLSSHQRHTYCEGIEALKDRTQAVVTRIGTDPARDVLSAFNNEGKEGVGVIGCTWQLVLTSHPLPVITPIGNTLQQI